MEKIKIEEANLADPEILRNPYPFYDLLREKSPDILWSDNLFGGCWIVMGYHDNLAFLKDNEFVSAKRERYLIDALPPELQSRYDDLLRIHAQWYVHYDPPEHTRVRRVMARGVSRQVLEKLRGEVVSHVQHAIEEMREEGEVDIMSGFAPGLPRHTIAALMGVEKEDATKFVTWVEHLAEYLGSEKPDIEVCDRAQEGIQAFREYFREMVKRRKAAPMQDDMVSHLISAEEGETLSEDELFAQCSLVAFAGNETTTNLVGNTLYLLQTVPGLLEQITNDLSLIPKLIEEVLRVENPVQFVNRIIKKDHEYKGHKLKKGDYVACMLGAANRDPRIYKDPDTFRVIRDEPLHLSFGPGIHACLGQGLARMEARIAIEEMLKAFPRMELLPQGAEWKDNPGLRGLKYLKLRLNPA